MPPIDNPARLRSVVERPARETITWLQVVANESTCWLATVNNTVRWRAVVEGPPYGAGGHRPRALQRAPLWDDRRTGLDAAVVLGG